MSIANRLFFLIICISFVITGCQKTQTPLKKLSDSQHCLQLNIQSEPQSLDPRKVRSLNDVNLIKMFMEGLSRTDREGNIALALAKKLDISSDRTTYTFTLRDAKWSNGDPITSFDFAYAWTTSLSPDFNSPSADLLYVIKHAQAIKQKKLPSSLLGIQTPDAKTLTIQLTRPIPYFLELIQHPIFFPIPHKIAKLNSRWANEKDSYIVNGPFQMKAWKHEHMIEAIKNIHYWDAKAVRLAGIKMVMVSEQTALKMFETAQLQWEGSPFSAIPLDELEALQEKHQLQISPALATAWIRVNTARCPFDSKIIRRAFGLAINRQDIVKHLTRGSQIPATGIVPTSLRPDHTPYFEDGDVSQAHVLLEEALQIKGITKEALPEITLTFAATEKNNRLAQLLQQQWEQAFGIRIKLEPLENKVFFSRINKQDYMLSIGSWFADFGDPINFLEVFETKQRGTNNTNWENPRYKQLLENSYLCQDPQERFHLLHESEALLMEEMPTMPLYHYTFLYVKNNRLKDVILTKTGYIDFKWAHLDND